MKKITKRTLENGIKTIAFIAVGCFVLLLSGVFGVYPVDTQTWYLIAILAGVCVLQWAVIVTVLNFRSDKSGEHVRMSPLAWILTFLPAAACIVALVLLYIFLSETDFFALDAVNLFISLGVLVLVFAISCIVDYAIVSAGKKIQKTVVKFVGKEKRTKKRGKALSGTIFPDLLTVDRKFELEPYAPQPSADVTLREVCDGFMNYLESHKMYYQPETVRAFVSGLACSHFVILEGLSGTGKTSLPKYFAEYIGASVCFTSVQASWRDRSDVLGYYNDFAGKFKETPFLRSLYSAGYQTDEVNLMVLDEMNLSRIEYYFADFLSVLELDQSQWSIELMPVSTGGVLPEKLEGCSVRIPQNVWFIGTANKDDSTFTITDKVYDRAAIIDFTQRNEPNGISVNVNPIHIGSEKLQALYSEAYNQPEYAFSREEYDKFSVLTQFMLDTFDINFGNRIMNQIVKFVPVYVACGGTVAKALDLMFARKVMRKLDGRFDDGVKGNLVRLEKLILQQYDKADFSSTLEMIAKLKRKLV